MIQDQSQSSFGLAPNVAAGLASLFTWAGGLVILLGKPPQQWVRFVAVQAIVMAVVCTGVVLSSLHGRAETRLFAKPVTNGRSKHSLSDEEQQAIREAMQ